VTEPTKSSSLYNNSAFLVQIQSTVFYGLPVPSNINFKLVVPAPLCPIGFRIPTLDELNILASAGDLLYSEDWFNIDPTLVLDLVKVFFRG